MLYNRVAVAAIKLGAGNVEQMGKNSKTVLIESIQWLKEQYERTEDISYLEKAVWHIYAYMEMGYIYDDGQEEFDSVLHLLGKNREDLFPKSKWNLIRVPLSKTKINTILGKWNPKLQSMKVTEAVDDIICHAKNREEGTYLYHCGKVIAEEGDEKLWQNTFRLYINQDEAILHNVNQNRYYLLEQEKA